MNCENPKIRVLEFLLSESECHVSNLESYVAKDAFRLLIPFLYLLSAEKTGVNYHTQFIGAEDRAQNLTYTITLPPMPHLYSQAHILILRPKC